MSTMTIGTPSLNTSRVLWRIIGANMNSTADQAFVKMGTFTNHIITGIFFTNASATPTAAAGGIYTTTSKGGAAIVAAGQAYAALSSSTISLSPALADANLRTNSALYLSLTAAAGGASTADIYVVGVAVT